VFAGSLTDAQAAAYTADGFEIAAHVNTGCVNWASLGGLNATFAAQRGSVKANYPSVPAPTTNRTHCVVWSDYSSGAQASLNRGIRLDTNFYYYPEGWILDRPGMFTGSGMPMRFA